MQTLESEIRIFKKYENYAEGKNTLKDKVQETGEFLATS